MDYMHLEGQQVGEYDIISLISTSGISETYLGYQPILKREVAIKVLLPTKASDPRFVASFMREAEIVAQLEHPNIIPIYDYGVQGSLNYIVRRLMPGGKLSEQIKRGQSMSFKDIIGILNHIADALDFVHSKNRVNGNVKPDNIVFDGWGHPFLTGFSLAGLEMSKDFIVGSPVYMAPETRNSGIITAESDQFSLALSVFEMLVGHIPHADSQSPVFHWNPAMQEALQVQRPDIPAATYAVLARALAEDRSNRYPTVIDFAREFEKSLQLKPKHVFVSYSRKDRDYALRLTEHLRNSGFEVWIDTRIEYGDTWFNEIEGAIKDCAAFVLLMSADSYQSEWVQKEILIALRHKKAIFPLLLDGEEFGIVINIQFADVRGQQMPEADFHRRLRRTVFGNI